MDLKKIFLKDACPTSIGGQAIMEGIMMRGPKKTAIAVRLSDGRIHMKTQPTPAVRKWGKIPIIRGVVNFVSSLVQGTKVLTYSADIIEENYPDEYEKDKFDVWIENKFGKEKAWKILIFCSVALAIVLSVVIFMLLPTVVVVNPRKPVTTLMISTAQTTFMKEPAARMIIFCHGFLLLNALGSADSSSSPSMAQKPPMGKSLML